MSGRRLIVSGVTGMTDKDIDEFWVLLLTLKNDGDETFSNNVARFTTSF